MSIEEKVTIARETAQKWLKLIDSFEYEASWTEAASYFQNSITSKEWSRTLQSVRQPLGKMLSRELESSQYATSLPGSPDGEYVVIQYNTSFKNKRSAIETVTPMLDRDSKWKVAGYFVK